MGLIVAGAGRPVASPACHDTLDRECRHYAGTVAGFVRYTLDVSAATVWIHGGGSDASVAQSVQGSGRPVSRPYVRSLRPPRPAWHLPSSASAARTASTTWAASTSK